MIEICPKCGNHEWDKEVEGNRIICPKCGNTWEFQKLPLFILTGCSGVGKTTTAWEIMQKKVDFVVLDADIFYGFFHDTEEDYFSWVEQIENISKDIMQSGRPVLWTMAGNLDKLNKIFHSRFFLDIYCLALICQEEELKERMRKGRGITDENWIQGSVDYNRFFMEHEQIGDMKFDTCDITGKTPSEAAEAVINWVKGERRKNDGV